MPTETRASSTTTIAIVTGGSRGLGMSGMPPSLAARWKILPFEATRSVP